MNKIPTIAPSIVDDFHFGKIRWVIKDTGQHHLFHINRLEDYRDKMVFPFPPHRKTVHDMIFITKGKSIRNKGMNSYEFGENQIFFLPALQITSHKMMEKDVEGFFLHFAPEILNDYAHVLNKFSFFSYLENPIITVPDTRVSSVLNILYRLEQLSAERNKENLDLIVQYVITLLMELNRMVLSVIPKGKKNTAAYITQQYKDALAQYIYQKQTVKEYATMFFVTPNHLNKCVKSTLNKTARDLLNEMLVLESKSLLKYSDLSISEIAVKLFDCSPSNFSRFFKKQTGITPKEYSER